MWITQLLYQLPVWHFTCQGFQASLRKMWRVSAPPSQRCRRPYWALSAPTPFWLDMAWKWTSVPWRWLLYFFFQHHWPFSLHKLFSNILQSWLTCDFKTSPGFFKWNWNQAEQSQPHSTWPSAKKNFCKEPFCYFRSIPVHSSCFNFKAVFCVRVSVYL